MKKEKKSKNLQNNTEFDLLPKPLHHEILYPDECVMNNEVGQKWMRRVGKTILHWASQEDSLEMGDFYFEYGISRQTLKNWCDKFEELDKMVKHAKMKIASRRSAGSYKRIYSDTVFKNIHDYDSAWDATNHYHSDLKNKENASKIEALIFREAGREISKEELAKQNQAIHGE